jgi:hypothetical protein
VRNGAYVQVLLAISHVWRTQEDLRRSCRFTMAGALAIEGAVPFLTVSGNSEPTHVPRCSILR